MRLNHHRAWVDRHEKQEKPAAQQRRNASPGDRWCCRRSLSLSLSLCSLFASRPTGDDAWDADQESGGRVCGEARSGDDHTVCSPRFCQLTEQTPVRQFSGCGTHAQQAATSSIEWSLQGCRCIAMPGQPAHARCGGGRLLVKARDPVVCVTGVLCCCVIASSVVDSRRPKVRLSEITVERRHVLVDSPLASQDPSIDLKDRPNGSDIAPKARKYGNDPPPARVPSHRMLSAHQNNARLLQISDACRRALRARCCSFIVRSLTGGTGETLNASAATCGRSAPTSRPGSLPLSLASRERIVQRSNSSTRSTSSNAGCDTAATSSLRALSFPCALPPSTGTRASERAVWLDQRIYLSSRACLRLATHS